MNFLPLRSPSHQARNKNPPPVMTSPASDVVTSPTSEVVTSQRPTNLESLSEEMKFIDQTPSPPIIQQPANQKQEKGENPLLSSVPDHKPTAPAAAAVETEQPISVFDSPVSETTEVEITQTKAEVESSPQQVQSNSEVCSQASVKSVSFICLLLKVLRTNIFY